jgi:hypothetical protein
MFIVNRSLLNRLENIRCSLHGGGLFFGLFQNISKELTPVATEKYLGGSDCPDKKKDLFLDMMGDVLFAVPSVIVARYHRGESWRLDNRGTLAPSISQMWKPMGVRTQGLISYSPGVVWGIFYIVCLLHESLFLGTNASCSFRSQSH